MGFNSISTERYYGRPVDQVYQAMKQFLLLHRDEFQLRNVDDLSYTCVFSSGISLTTWGENLTASVVPSGSGSIVRLTVAGKVGMTATGFQDAHSTKISNQFFNGVSAILSGGGTSKNTNANHDATGTMNYGQPSRASGSTEDSGNKIFISACIIIIILIVILFASYSNSSEDSSAENGEGSSVSSITISSIE